MATVSKHRSSPAAERRGVATTAATATVVWIDARRATLLPWPPSTRATLRFESTVPPHHRSSGRLDEKGAGRHGGGGSKAVRERHRLEHLRAFLEQVHASLPPGDLLLVGDGTVVDRLAALVHAEDARLFRSRRVGMERADRPTDAQLVERLRDFAGTPPRRRRPGAAGGTRRRRSGGVRHGPS